MEVPHQPQRTTIVLPSTPPTTSTTILAQLSLHSPGSTALSLWKLHFPSTIPLHSCTLPLAPLLLHLPSTLCSPPLLSWALLGGCASQSPPRQLGVAPPHAPPLRCVRGWFRPSLWLTFFALRGFLGLVFFTFYFNCHLHVWGATWWVVWILAVSLWGSLSAVAVQKARRSLSLGLFSVSRSVLQLCSLFRSLQLPPSLPSTLRSIRLHLSLPLRRRLLGSSM